MKDLIPTVPLTLEWRRMHARFADELLLSLEERIADRKIQLTGPEAKSLLGLAVAHYAAAAIDVTPRPLSDLVESLDQSLDQMRRGEGRTLRPVVPSPHEDHGVRAAGSAGQQEVYGGVHEDGEGHPGGELRQGEAVA